MAHGPQTWEKALPYEKLETINEIHKWIRIGSLSRDHIEVQEVVRYRCCTGLAPVREVVLSICGVATFEHEAVYLYLVRRLRATVCADLSLDVRFTVRAGDHVPQHCPVQPLIESAQTRASRYWTRVSWAMRCGILHKIAETRALTQVKINASANVVHSSTAMKRQTSLFRIPPTAESSPTTEGGGGPSATPPRAYHPVQRYTEECANTTLTLQRFAASGPTLVVVWASWDQSSLEWLTRHVFHGSAIAEMQAGDSDEADDPWVKLLKQFVNCPPPVSWHDIAPAMPNGKRSHKLKNAPVAAAPVNSSATSTLKGPKWRRQPSLRKRGNLILISVDSDKDAASSAYNDLVRNGLYWRSSDVSFSSLWVGEEGMRSDLATRLDVATLPRIMATDNASRSQVPVIRIAETLHKAVAADLVQPTRRNADGALLSPVKGQFWHDVPSSRRREIEETVSRLILTNDAPLAFHSLRTKTYPMLFVGGGTSPPPASTGGGGDGASGGRRLAALQPYTKESQLEDCVVKSSLVELNGSGSTHVLRTIKEEILFLSQLRKATVQVVTYRPSAALTVSFGAPTLQQRVKGLQQCRNCEHCSRVLHTPTEMHLHCLHCSAAVCHECYENRAHSPSGAHVCVKLRAGPDTWCKEPPVWGHQNVVELPTIRGKPLTNITGLHLNVFCNSCKAMIQRDRWKCCFCHDVDLCGACEAQWWRSITSENRPTRQSVITVDYQHDPSHYFMHIRHAPPGNVNSFLQPQVEPL